MIFGPSLSKRAELVKALMAAGATRIKIGNLEVDCVPAHMVPEVKRYQDLTPEQREQLMFASS